MNTRPQKTSSLQAKSIFMAFFLLTLLVVIASFGHAEARNKKAPSQQIGVNGFLDEDGDGFNDLLPDSDGDGVPDALDPDFKGRHGDSLGDRQHGFPSMPDSGGPRHDEPGEMGPHGEPGMFGPGDTTGHHGMHDGDGHDGHDGHGPRGGGDMQNPPDSLGTHKVTPGTIVPPTENQPVNKEANPVTGAQREIQKDIDKR